GEAARQLGHRADLAAQADLAEGDQLGGHRPVAGGRGQAPAGGPGGGRRGGRLRAAEARAGQTPRSAGGSVILTPPAVAANTSLPARPMRAPRSSTATRMASRPASSPWAVRRGTATPVGTTSAWTSVTSGRRPSRLTVQATPGTPAERADRNSRDGSASGSRPASVISKQPTSYA